MHVELVQFGFGKGCTPGLQEAEVAPGSKRAVCPSLSVRTAGTGTQRCETGREGHPQDRKPVRTRLVVAADAGTGVVACRETLAGRHGTSGETGVGADRRWAHADSWRITGVEAASVPAQRNADGLPCENVPGRSRKRARRTFTADWREPKLLTIFVHDEQGRMVKESKATVDGTLLGPDAVGRVGQPCISASVGGGRKAPEHHVCGVTAVWDLGAD